MVQFRPEMMIECKIEMFNVQLGEEAKRAAEECIREGMRLFFRTVTAEDSPLSSWYEKYRTRMTVYPTVVEDKELEEGDEERVRSFGKNRAWMWGKRSVKP